jgi:hypothetical protein
MVVYMLYYIYKVEVPHLQSRKGIGTAPPSQYRHANHPLSIPTGLAILPSSESRGEKGWMSTPMQAVWIKALCYIYLYGPLSSMYAGLSHTLSVETSYIDLNHSPLHLTQTH